MLRVVSLLGVRFALARLARSPLVVVVLRLVRPDRRQRLGLGHGRGAVSSGAMLFALGVVAEYLGVAVNMAMGKPLYLIVSDRAAGPLGATPGPCGQCERGDRSGGLLGGRARAALAGSGARAARGRRCARRAWPGAPPRRRRARRRPGGGRGRGVADWSGARVPASSAPREERSRRGGAVGRSSARWRRAARGRCSWPRRRAASTPGARGPPFTERTSRGRSRRTASRSWPPRTPWPLGCAGGGTRVAIGGSPTLRPRTRTSPSRRAWCRSSAWGALTGRPVASTSPWTPCATTSTPTTPPPSPSPHARPGRGRAGGPAGHQIVTSAHATSVAGLVGAATLAFRRRPPVVYAAATDTGQVRDLRFRSGAGVERSRRPLVLTPLVVGLRATAEGVASQHRDARLAVTPK